jgi:outer membrane protein OmpA-like peptidoglycan-associated protein
MQQGFFVSSRDQAGKDDLYRFARLLPEPARMDSTPSEKQKKDLFLVVRSYEPIYQVSDDPNSGVTGKKILGNTQISLLNREEGFRSENRSDAKGFYFTQVSTTQIYDITVSREGYLSSVLQFDGRTAEFASAESSLTINKEVILEKIFPQKEIRLENIYYDYDSWEILPAAMPSLNRLADILKANPTVRIQLTSHTDCRGELEYNLVLSQKRAQAAVDYLITQGISSNRMIAVGRGEEALVEMCPCESCTEEQHQANRRTTFMILENP